MDTQIDLPLRGLAGEGAIDRVRRAVMTLPGVSRVEGGASEFLVRVTYDEARVSSEAIRRALHELGANGGAHEP